jgi:hypothetical protein
MVEHIAARIETKPLAVTKYKIASERFSDTATLRLGLSGRLSTEGWMVWCSVFIGLVPCCAGEKCTRHARSFGVP